MPNMTNKLVTRKIACVVRCLEGLGTAWSLLQTSPLVRQKLDASLPWKRNLVVNFFLNVSNS
jgi:hypothetical protein